MTCHSKKPPNPDPSAKGHFPSWLHRRMPPVQPITETQQSLQKARLHTVCEEAKCPNRMECFAQKTATFLLLGNTCTRACSFCEIGYHTTPPPPDPKEPEHVAQCTEELELQHVVLTMVARDDLPDGGANHLVQVMQAIRNRLPTITIEVLTSDFSGNFSALDTLLSHPPEIFNHNIETVRSLSPKVRHKATYERSLSILRYVKQQNAPLFIKSGLMVGLGEAVCEVEETLLDLQQVGCDVVTIGQYLQASPRKRKVAAYIHPDQFTAYKKFGHRIGIREMYCGPFVRSSYHASAIKEQLL